MGGPPNLYSRNPNFQNPDSPEKAEVGAASNEMAVGFPQTLNPKPFIVWAEGKQQPRSFALISRSEISNSIRAMESKISALQPTEKQEKGRLLGCC